MCEPTLIATVGTFLSGAAPAATYATAATATSLGIGAYTSYQQARTNKAVAESNATLADRQAADAVKRGEEAAIDARRRGSVTEGAQRNSMAARGLDLSEGTPADILGQTDFFTQTDIATARTNGRREASARTAQANNYRAEADSINPGLTLAGTLLGSGARVADKWYSNRRP